MAVTVRLFCHRCACLLVEMPATRWQMGIRCPLCGMLNMLQMGSQEKAKE